MAMMSDRLAVTSVPGYPSIRSISSPKRFSHGRRGFSLLEVLVATTVFALALVPSVGLLMTSSKEVEKVSQRLVAAHLAMSLVEEMRSRRPADRTDMADAHPADVAHLAPIVQAYRAAHAATASTIDKILGNFTCRSSVLAGLSTPTVEVEVSWLEGGTERKLKLESRLDGP